MLIAFQIILFFVIIATLDDLTGEDKQSKELAATVAAVAILAATATFLF